MPIYNPKTNEIREKKQRNKIRKWMACTTHTHTNDKKISERKLTNSNYLYAFFTMFFMSSFLISALFIFHFIFIIILVLREKSATTTCVCKKSKQRPTNCTRNSTYQMNQASTAAAALEQVKNEIRKIEVA